MRLGVAALAVGIRRQLRACRRSTAVLTFYVGPLIGKSVQPSASRSESNILLSDQNELPPGCEIDILRAGEVADDIHLLSVFLGEERAYARHRRGGLLFHEPVAGICDHKFRHIGCDEADVIGHRRAE